MISSFIEPLESRIAPASALAPFGDRDGDSVTIKITTVGGSSADLKTALEAAQTFILEGQGLQLQALDLTDPIFKGANVTIKATRDAAKGGDGLVAVGRIEATGQTLGKVTVDGDLGKIVFGVAGDTQAIKSLTVQSFGRYGAETGGGNLSSSFAGGVGKLTVKEDIVGAEIRASTFARLSVGGSIIGGDNVFGGTFFGSSNGASVVKIGGDIIAGAGSNSGKVFFHDPVKSFTLGGSLFGPADGAEEFFGQLQFDNAVRKVVIKGDVIGGTDEYLLGGQVDIDGKVGTLQIGGSLLGVGDYVSSAPGGGSVFLKEAAKSVTIGGNIAGGTAFQTGVLLLQKSAQTISVGGSLIGGVATSTGSIILDQGTIKSLSVAGDLIGSGAFSGAIDGNLNTTIQKLTIGGNFDVRGESFIRANVIESLIIKGDVIASSVDGETNEAIRGLNGIGTISIGGSILGNEVNTVRIVTTTLGSLTVGKNAQYAEIAVTDLESKVQSLAVNGAWISSRFTFANDDGADNIYGTADDPAVNAAFDGTISSIVIKGQVVGTFGGTDSYVIRAPKIGALSIAGTVYPLTAGADDFNLGITADVTVVDLK
ncbi:MAG TPA: hypothetical protein VF614_10515 [Chthoniobacteraceae bacterium]